MSSFRARQVTGPEQGFQEVLTDSGRCRQIKKREPRKMARIAYDPQGKAGSGKVYIQVSPDTVKGYVVTAKRQLDNPLGLDLAKTAKYHVQHKLDGNTYTTTYPKRSG